jgi:hypothetical protein
MPPSSYYTFVAGVVKLQGLTGSADGEPICGKAARYGADPDPGIPLEGPRRNNWHI